MSFPTLNKIKKSVVFTLKQTLLSVQANFAEALLLSRNKCRNDTTVFTGVCYKRGRTHLNNATWFILAPVLWLMILLICNGLLAVRSAQLTAHYSPWHNSPHTIYRRHNSPWHDSPRTIHRAQLTAHYSPRHNSPHTIYRRHNSSRHNSRKIKNFAR
jgi:hypothetical protein